jgi:hypothetical protein
VDVAQGCGVAQECGVTQGYGVPQMCGVALSVLRSLRVLRSSRVLLSSRVWRSSGGSTISRLAVRQARVKFPARHLRGNYPTELTSDEELERNLSEWRWMNVME